MPPFLRACFFLGFGLAFMAMQTPAQTADQGWLDRKLQDEKSPVPLKVTVLGQSELENTAGRELESGLDVLYGAASILDADAIKGEAIIGTARELRAKYPSALIPAGLDAEGYWIGEIRLSKRTLLLVAGGDARGVLYGAFALVRELATRGWSACRSLSSHPAMPIRWVDEWDNADGSVERGYAGRSIFFEGGKVRDDLGAVGEYARLLASIGINGCNVNNVNNAAAFLQPDMLQGLARVADTMRPERCGKHIGRIHGGAAEL